MLIHRVGFGLIEVLIVLSIIGIVAALTIPAFLDNTQQADSATATTEASATQGIDSQTDAGASARSEQSKGAE
jgi:prepilin-type N-terminal cleavage/methylation domain-containing protein